MRARKLKLTNGGFTKVSAQDFEWLSKFKWRAVTLGRHKKNGRGYVYAARCEGSRKVILMHREILNPENGKLVDHRDGDGLNNTRRNIRIAENWQNSANRRLDSTNTSGYRGVCRFRGSAKKKWQAVIYIRGKQIYLGAFATRVAAAQAFDIAARKHRGKFARLNFPK